MLGRGVVCAVGAAAALAAPAAAIEVEVVNRSERPDRQVHLTLTGGSSSDGTLTENVPTRLSNIPRRSFELGSISAARIYVAYGGGVRQGVSPVTSRRRYDKVELTNPGDVNLTSVDFFGIPFKIVTRSKDGRALQTRRFRCDARSITAHLTRIPGARRAVKRHRGRFLRVLSPNHKPQAYPPLAPYVRSLRGKELRIRDTFEGTPVTRYDYRARVRPDGSIVAEGTLRVEGSAPTAGQRVVLPGGRALTWSIYTANGPFTVGGESWDVARNDVYAAIYRDLISGFAFGYWGGRYGNDSARWKGRQPFGPARRGSRARFAAFDEYSAVINRLSDAYGYPFSDVGPKKVLAPLNARTAKLEITILPDRERRRPRECRV